MNKNELIAKIAVDADVSNMVAEKMLHAMLDGIQSTLKAGGTVTLVGFGTFLVRQRAARTGRNPRTGETLMIAASKVPAFKPGKALKEEVQ